MLTMKKINKLTKSIATVSLISLSALSLNLPQAIATTASTPKTIQSSSQVANAAFCEVINIQTGQLAVRYTPNGKPFAGLDNGNVVELMHSGPGVWVRVRVIQGPNRAVDGREGWVNSSYLNCYDLG